MIYEALSLLMLFSVFSMIGIGPACIFFKKDLSLERILIFSPILGYIFIVISGVYLTLLNIRVEVWSYPLLFLGIIFSFFSLYNSKNIFYSFKLKKNYFIYFLVGFFILFLLLTLPIIIGDINFTTFRGNGTDSFNYMTMAGFLQKEPLFFLKIKTSQELLNLHSSYLLAHSLLNDRWATSMILAFYSTIVQLHIYRLDYAYTLFFYMMSFGVSFLFCQKLIKSNFWICLLVSFVICLGFWGQFVLDKRAMSFMSVFPLILFFSYNIADLDMRELKKQYLLGLTGSSMFLLYAEIIPTLVLSMLIYFFIQLKQNKNAYSLLKTYAVIMGIGLIFLIPSWSFLWLFLKKQLVFAINFKNNWHLAYFNWLYTRPLVGFWGFGPFLDTRFLIKMFYVVSILLSLSVCRGIYLVCLTNLKNNFLNMTASFVLSSSLLFIILLSKEQYWAAGKILSYAYPFFIFIMLSSSFEIIHSNKFLGKMMYFAIFVYFFSQIYLSILRISNVYERKDYINYISGHGYYRQHDLEDKDFRKVISEKKCLSIGIDIKDPWLQEYFNFVFGWDTNIYNMKGIYNRDMQKIGEQKTIRQPDCILRRIDNSNYSSKVVAKNTEFELVLTKSPVN